LGAKSVSTKEKTHHPRPCETDSHCGLFATNSDGGCYVTIFAGPEAEKRVREALRGKWLKIISRDRR
jgi:hypothetical protein